MVGFQTKGQGGGVSTFQKSLQLYVIFHSTLSWVIPGVGLLLAISGRGSCSPINLLEAQAGAQEKLGLTPAGPA